MSTSTPIGPLGMVSLLYTEDSSTGRLRKGSEVSPQHPRKLYALNVVDTGELTI
jgi:hypothetical protein